MLYKTLPTTLLILILVLSIFNPVQAQFGEGNGKCPPNTPTWTKVPTETPVPTNTPTDLPTETPTDLPTITSTATNTPTEMPTNTVVYTPTNTVETPTNMPTIIPTLEPPTEKTPNTLLPTTGHETNKNSWLFSLVLGLVGISIVFRVLIKRRSL